MILLRKISSEFALITKRPTGLSESGRDDYPNDKPYQEGHTNSNQLQHHQPTHSERIYMEEVQTRKSCTVHACS